MMIKATVSITTLQVHEVAIDLKKVSLQDGKGSFSVEEGAQTAISWRVRDSPQQKYKIEIKAEGAKVVMRGGSPHPIELKIPKAYTLGAGHRVLSLVREKQDA
ncbi:MAG TPA: hypothetical protein VGM84_19585 [Steroidobacteraceae bacterium]|jgi:hypothetical protein